MVSPEAAALVGAQPTRTGTVRIFENPLSPQAEERIRVAADQLWVATFGDYQPEQFAFRRYVSA